jgi:tetraacyldisaccharide 4'-kinase
VAALRGRQALAFAGIGDPDKFFATLAEAGIDAPVRRGFPDHHRYGLKAARELIRQAEREGLALVTTEKDLARLKGDHNVAMLAERATALPVALRVEEAADLRQGVLGALRRA